MVTRDAAVRTDRYVDSRFVEVLVAGRGDLDQRRCLTATDALLFARNANRSAADADLHEVGACLDQIQEAFAIDDIAAADGRLAEVLLHELNGVGLPFRISIRRIDAQQIDAGVDQRRDAFGMVECVDASTDDEALLTIDELQWELLCSVVVLAEH